MSRTQGSAGGVERWRERQCSQQSSFEAGLRESGGTGGSSSLLRLSAPGSNLPRGELV